MKRHPIVQAASIDNALAVSDLASSVLVRFKRGAAGFPIEVGFEVPTLAKNRKGGGQPQSWWFQKEKGVGDPPAFCR